MTHRIRQFAEESAELGLECGKLDYDELTELVKDHAPIGVFVSRDADGLNVLNRLMIKGFRIGKDVLLVSFDDHSQCVYSIPSLSSVHQPTREEGRLAVKKLISMIFGNDEKNETIRPYLMVRESSGGTRPDPGYPATECIIR